MARKQFLDGPQIEAWVQAVAQGMPGWGAALQLLRKHNKFTAGRLSKIIGSGESTIHGWEGEKHHPRAATLRNVLIALSIDPNLIRKHLGEDESPVDCLGVLSVNAHPKIVITEILASLPPDSDPEVLETALYEKLVIPTIAAQAVRALQGNVHSAKFLLDRADSIRRTKRRSSNTPSAAGAPYADFEPAGFLKPIADDSVDLQTGEINPHDQGPKPEGYWKIR